MAYAISSPSDVVNLALGRIGYKLRVANLYDGSAAARTALDMYSQTRDALLRDGDWPFASRSVTATLLKEAPAYGYIPPTVWSTAYPPLPWRYEYAWPDDCLKIRAVKGVTLFVPNFDPQPNLFSISNDNGFTPPQRVVLSNIPSAILTYTGQVTDPLTWPQDFIEEFASGLGRRMAPSLTSLDVAKLEAGDEAAQNATASAQQG